MLLMLATDRLILRPFQDSDLQPFVAYRSDPDIAQYQGWDAPYSLTKATEFIEEMKRARPGNPGQWYQLAVALKNTGEMIGDCAFCVLAEDDRQAEIGFTLAGPYQGYGYATEAVTALLDHLFGTLCLHRVRAICDVENVASARLLERLGMRREGCFIDSVWFKGKWASEYWYAILRTEWTTRRSSSSV